MKKLFVIAIAALFSVFSLAAVTEEKVTGTQPLEILWIPSDSNFARIGFSDAPVNSITVNPSNKSEVTLKLDSVERVGDTLKVSNRTPLYVYCQFYGNQVCYVDLKVGSLTNKNYQDINIPINVEYNNLIVSSGEAVNAIFSYDTTKAVHVDFVELDVSAEISDIDNLPAASFSGNITLELRFQ